MKTSQRLAIVALFTVSACGSPGDVGDECFDDGDCAEGLECHLHEHDGEVSDHGECEEHEEGHEEEHEGE